MTTVLYDVFHGMAFNWLEPLYFYLNGLSVGLFIISTLGYVFGLERYKRLGIPYWLAALALIAVTPALLIAELAQPLRFVHLFFAFNPTSPISWGVVLLTLYPLVLLVYGYYIWKGNAAKAKTVGMLGIPVAIATHGYTGFLIALVETRVMWHTALMPVMFLVFTAVSALALAIIIASALNKYQAVVLELGKILAWAIVVNVILIFSYLAMFAVGSQAAFDALLLVTTGSFGFLFWTFVIILGSLLPFVLVSTKTKEGYAIASLFAMVGVFVMRYIIVIGGLTLPL